MKKSLLNLNFKEEEQSLLKKIKYLLNNGVDINEKNNDGNTALFLAIINNKNEILKYLLKNNAKQSILNEALTNPLFLSILFENKEAFKILIKDAINNNKISLLNSMNSNGETLVMYSFLKSQENGLDMFEDLLKLSKYTLSMNMVNLNDETLLDLINKEDSKKALNLYNKYINKEFEKLQNKKDSSKIKNIEEFKNKVELDLNEDFSFI